MRVLVVLLVAFLTTTVCAETYNFGRIFTDNQQRKQIDELRKHNKEDFDTEIVATQPTRVPEDQQLKRLTYSGATVIEEDGRTAWIDGKSAISGFTLPRHKIEKGSTRLKIRTSTSESSLKPGQTWLIEQNQILEAWQKVPEIKTPETEPSELVNTGSSDG